MNEKALEGVERLGLAEQEKKEEEEKEQEQKEEEEKNEEEVFEAEVQQSVIRPGRHLFPIHCPQCEEHIEGHWTRLSLQRKMMRVQSKSDTLRL